MVSHHSLHENTIWWHISFFGTLGLYIIFRQTPLQKMNKYIQFYQSSRPRSTQTYNIKTYQDVRGSVKHIKLHPQFLFVTFPAETHQTRSPRYLCTERLVAASAAWTPSPSPLVLQSRAASQDRHGEGVAAWIWSERIDQFSVKLEGNHIFLIDLIDITKISDTPMTFSKSGNLYLCNSIGSCMDSLLVFLGALRVPHRGSITCSQGLYSGNLDCGPWA